MQNHIRKIRKERGLTLDQVAEFVHATKAQISKMERGIVRLNDQWLDVLSKLFHCSVHDLIDDDVSYPPRHHSLKELEGVVVANMQGYVDCKQVGSVEYIDSTEQYSLSFSYPAILRQYGKKHTGLFALTLKNAGFLHFSEGAQMIFAYVNHLNKELVHCGSVVFCMQKDQQGKYSGYCLRRIEINRHGYPQAVYKVQKTKHAATVMANSYLFGMLSEYEAMKRFHEMDQVPFPKNAHQKEIFLENTDLDIKAVLVKVICDVWPEKNSFRQ